MSRKIDILYDQAEAIETKILEHEKTINSLLKDHEYLCKEIIKQEKLEYDSKRKN